MPLTPSPDETRSASTPGPDVLAGKNAKNDGCCHWVRPGTTYSSRSASTSPMSPPVAGGPAGSRAKTSPGSTGDWTGNVWTRSQYEATQST